MEEKKEKRYYWLKLNTTFFEQQPIKILRGAKNGDKYIVFYLNLLTYAAPKFGLLRLSDELPYSYQMLAAMTCTDIDVVNTAMTLLIQLGLVSIFDDGTIYLTGAEKMVGSEGEAAQRMRRLRSERKQEITAGEPEPEQNSEQCYEQCAHNVRTNSEQSAHIVKREKEAKRENKSLEIRDQRLEINMTDKERTSPMYISDTEVRARACDVILYSKDYIYESIRDYTDNTLRLKALQESYEQVAEQTGDHERLAYFEAIANAVRHPWNRQDLFDLQSMTSAQMAQVIFNINNQLWKGTHIEDVAKYTWTAIRATAKQVRGSTVRMSLCASDEADLREIAAKTRGYDGLQLMERAHEAIKAWYYHQEPQETPINVRYAIAACLSAGKIDEGLFVCDFSDIQFEDKQ